MYNIQTIHGIIRREKLVHGLTLKGCTRIMNTTFRSWSEKVQANPVFRVRHLHRMTSSQVQ